MRAPRSYLRGLTRRIHPASALSLLLGTLLAAFLVLGVTGSRAATPRPVVLIGSDGTPGGGQSIDLGHDFAAANTSIAALPDDSSSAEVAVPDLNFNTVTLTDAVITADGTNYTVVIRGKASGLFELGTEKIELLLLATWGAGGAAPATISLGGYVPHNFDLSLLNDKFQYPVGQPEFKEVWLTQSTGIQSDPSAAAGAAGFYPTGHEIPNGVGFRAELDPASIIGDYAAGLLGYGSGKTVALLGSFAAGTTIYNSSLTLETDTTLEGHMDLSGVGPLFGTLTFGDDFLISLELDTHAPNSQTGGVFNYGIKVEISGSAHISDKLLGTPLDVSVTTSFEYATEADKAIVIFKAAVTPGSPWVDPFGLTGFSADKVDILLRFTTDPSVQSAKFVVTGQFSNTYLTGVTFDVSFDLTYKNGALSAAVTVKLAGDITLKDLFDAFHDIASPDLPPANTWDLLKSIQLNDFTAHLRVSAKDVKLYLEAGATVSGLDVAVALYVGPDSSRAGKYGFILAARNDGDLNLKTLVPALPAGISDVTLPDTIFYFSSLEIDADRFDYPTPLLFDFFAPVWGAEGRAGEKIAIVSGAGIVSRIDTKQLIPPAVADFLHKALWVDVTEPVVIAGNVPLFGKTKVDLTVQLPEARPDPETDGAPEFFQSAGFFLHMEVNQQKLLFSISGKLNVRLRKFEHGQPVNATPFSEDNYDHLELSASAKLELQLGPPPTVSATLQGSVTAPDGFQPFGLDWLEFNNLTLQLSLGTTPDGNVAIKFGLRTKFQIGQQNPLDVDASLVISVQTLQAFPFATLKLNGVRLKSNRGIETDDLLALADLFTGQSLNITVPDSFPNIAIRNFEVSYSDDNYPSLCLTKGFRIRGDLYVNPTGGTDAAGPGCDSGPPPEPGSSCAGDSPAAQTKRAQGCVAGIDLEVFGIGGQQEAGLAGSFAIAAFDIGTTIHFGNAQIELILNRSNASLAMKGSLTIDGVGSGSAELKFTATGIELKADAQLFNAFWAHLEVLGTIDPRNPSLQARGYLQTDFGSQISQALQQEAANLRAILAALDSLVQEFQDPNNGLDDLASAIMTLPSTLQAYGVQSGPALTAVADFTDRVNKFIRDAQNDGKFPSLDEIVNNILQGKEIVLTKGVQGTYWPEKKFCAGWVTRKGRCIGVWVYPKCRFVVVNGTCWAIPPVTLKIPGLCTLGLVRFPGHACNATGLKLTVADAVMYVFNRLTGLTYEQVRDALDQALASSGDIPTLFDVTCAAFSIDLGNGAAYSNTLQLGIEVILLGQKITTGNLTWDFKDTIGANTTDLVMTLVKNLLLGQSDGPIQGCAAQAPPPPGDTGVPTNLQVTLSPAPVAEGSTLALDASFDEPGVQSGDTRTYQIAWGDGQTTNGTLAVGVTAFHAGHVYADDPSGANDKRTLTVTVVNSRAGSVGASKSVTVLNVAPAAGSFSATPSQISEGGQVTVNGSFTDPGTADTHTVMIEWHDGSPPSAASVDQQANTFTAVHTYADDDPTDTAQDSVQVVATIRDDDGGQAVAGTSVTVSNVDPIASLSAERSTYHEGDTIKINGTLSDAGIKDLHHIEIDWSEAGVKVVQKFALPFGETSFSASMLAIDDNPTATPSDQIDLIVHLLDDDNGDSEYSLSLTLINDPPSALTVSVDQSPIDENGTVTATVEWTDPGIADEHSIVIDWGDGSTPTVVDPEIGDREATASHQYLDDDPSGTPSDVYTVRATVSDDDTGEASATTTVQVLDVAPVLQGPDPTSVQYSDPLDAPIIVHAFDVQGYPGSLETLVASTRWSVDGSAPANGLPPNLTLTSLGCAPGGEPGSTEPRQTCKWALDSTPGTTLDIEPGTYTIELTVEDDDGLSSTAEATLVVLPEDARVYYAGPTAAALLLNHDGSARLQLRAIVRDISSESPAEPDWDPYPGDIDHATVTFVDRGTGDVLCTAPVVPLFPGITSTGDAWCYWDIPASALAAGPATFSLGFRVGGWYVRDSTADDAAVTVSGPDDASVKGSSTFRFDHAAGHYSPDPDGNVDLEVQAEFATGRHSRTTRLNGSVILDFTSGGRRYRIVTSALHSLGTVCLDRSRGLAEAQIEATALLRGGTSSRSPLLAGDLRLQLRLTADNDDEGTSVAFALWAADGELLISSNWTGTGTAPTAFGPTPLRIHPDDRRSDCEPPRPVRSPRWPRGWLGNRPSHLFSALALDTPLPCARSPGRRMTCTLE